MRSACKAFWLFFVLLVCYSHLSFANNQTWRLLFNGKDLDGWEHVGTGSFTLADGLLRTKDKNGLLWYTKEKFGNCTIRVVYKTNDPAANSGVFVRMSDKPKNIPDALEHGYGIQIYDPEPKDYHTGSIYNYSRASTLATYPAGKWNTLDITLKDKRIIVDVNGITVSELNPEKDSRPEYGYIGIQNNAQEKNGKMLQVWFKEISVRPLP